MGAPSIVTVTAVLALLAGCATPPPAGPLERAKTSRTFGGVPPDAAFERTLAVIRAEGLNITGADEAGGVITAALDGFQDRGWAECTARRVTEMGRFRWADQLDRHLELTATVRGAPSGGAEVALDLAFAERQRDSFTNITFLEPCRSTGALERRILDSI